MTTATRPIVAEPPPPYGIIKSELLLGKAIPFLGAGASRVARSSLSSAGTSTVESPVLLPSGSQLARELALESGFPSDSNDERTDLAKVSSYYVDGSNRDALRLRLRRIFTDSRYEANQLHGLLAEIANGESLEWGSIFVTTNCDNLLEARIATILKIFAAVFSLLAFIEPSLRLLIDPARSYSLTQPIWFYLLCGGALGCFGFDRYMGYSETVKRCTFVAGELQRGLADFQMEWAMQKNNRDLLFMRARDFRQFVEDVVRRGTEEPAHRASEQPSARPTQNSY